MTAVVETAVRDSRARAEVMRQSAAALGDAKLQAAVESFLAANAALQNSHLGEVQISDDPPLDAEYLYGEAQHYWDMLATGWAEHLLPQEVREAGAEYARPKIVHVPVVQASPCDWSKGRTA